MDQNKRIQINHIINFKSKDMKNVGVNRMYECKIHGLVEFYLYKGKKCHCKICEREKRKKNYYKKTATPEGKEELRKKYLDWTEKNFNKVLEYRKLYHDIKHKKRENEISLFYKKYGKLIKDVSGKLELKKTPDLYRIKDPSPEKIISQLLKRKYREILSRLRWRNSTYVKWHKLGTLNLKQATDEEKIEIRKEYKEISEKQAKKELEKISKRIL